LPVDILDFVGEVIYVYEFGDEGYHNNVLYNFSSVIIEQYTGLEDKNGVEIYYGDRLSMTDEVGKNGVVTVGFESGGFIVFAGFAWRYIGTYDELKNNIEVIGNIHDGENK